MAYSEQVGAKRQWRPISAEKAHELVAEHNQKLRRELGLQDEPKEDKTARLDWSVDVAGLPARGAGLRLRVEF